MPISLATVSDIPGLVSLLNRAYRGEASKKGWTTEANMISGEIRTDEEQLGKLWEKPGSVFLLSTHDDNRIVGCVYLDKRGDRLYLGMLSVDPLLQDRGIGKQLLEAAENYATGNGCHCIFMRVVSERPELIAWYERRGYYKTGEVQPFEDSRFGRARVPLEFWVMQKDL